MTRIAPNEEPLKKSVILEYNLANLSSKSYDAVRVLIDERDHTEYKYEVEGIAMYNNYKYICSNATGIAGSHPQADALCKLVQS